MSSICAHTLKPIAGVNAPMQNGGKKLGPIVKLASNLLPPLASLSLPKGNLGPQYVGLRHDTRFCGQRPARTTGTHYILPVHTLTRAFPPAFCLGSARGGTNDPSTASYNSQPVTVEVVRLRFSIGCISVSAHLRRWPGRGGGSFRRGSSGL